MALLPATMAWAAEMKMTFPQNRKTFQTNELINVSIVRSGEGDLPAGNVTLVLTPGRNVLPYKPSPTFPGKGNGMVAWNIQALGHDVHALVCLAYDAEGMSQAVGTLFELGVGLDPLFPLAIPSSATIEVTK